MTAKVLIVDDDLESLKLVGLMLQGRGYQIVAAQSGLQALNRAATESPDLIILDVMMPDMDGLEVCRRLRANPATANTPVIMFTAKSLVDDKVAGFEAGADEYLTKPIHPAELLTRVEVLLARVVRTGPRPAALRATVVGFMGSKGGVGTSTLAINTAVALAQGPAEDKKVMLVEFHNTSTTLALQMGLAPQQGLHALAERSVTALDADTVMAQMDRHSSGVTVLGGVSSLLNTPRSLDASRAEAVLRNLGEVADYLLVDMGSGLDEVNQATLRITHYLLVVMEPHRVALRMTETLLENLDELEIGRHRIGIVLVNKAPSATTLTKGMVEERLQRDVVGVISPAPELAFHAADQGRPMVTVQPASLVARQLAELAEHLTAL